MNRRTGAQGVWTGALRSRPSRFVGLAATFALCCLAIDGVGPALAQQSGAAVPVSLEAKIPLGSVAGRIDHLAIDVEHRRLFVAELGNNTVSVVDLGSKKVLHRIDGLSEPQGIAYAPSSGIIFIANGGNGTVRVYSGADYSPVAQLKLGDDADNVRLDDASGRVLVGFGSGAIAAIDPKDNTKIAESRLPAHPESFQIDSSSGRVFVNLPSADSIAVLGSDLRTQQNWHVPYSGNFAMALDPAGHRVLVAYRRPTRLVTYDEDTGRPLVQAETCGDADDLFYDPDTRRIYVICGSGSLDVFDAASGKLSRTARVRTAPGARTGIFVPELHRLLIAVRGNWGEAPGIWVYRINQ